MNKFISTLAISSFLLLGSLYGQQANRESVTKLYIASFDRAPDSTGLNYWVGQTTMSLEEIATSFFDQQEMKEQYPADSTTTDFVNAVYLNLFDRESDAEGLSYWSEKLDDGSVTRSEFVLAATNGATGDDATILTNKSIVGVKFVESGSNDATMAKNILQGITADPTTVDSALAQIDTISTDTTYCQTTTSIVLDNYTKDELTQEQKYSLAYMWHEEKLAKEIYLELNKIYPTNQLEKIANNAEVKHIEFVQNLVAWYDINITNIANYEIKYSAEELDSMPVGKYAIEDIENLYNLLYEKGSGSQQASLEVGCIVEVTDINDLDDYLVTAGTNQALIDTFKILRSGSYEHYWAFDKGLVAMAISDGCCSLGDEYCHREYPQSENGSGSSGSENSQNQNGGAGYRHGQSQ